MFDVGLLVLVEMNLEESGSVKPDPDTLANDLSRVNKVVEDGVVNGNQCTGPTSLLLQLVGLSGRLGQDPPLGNEDDMLAGELLLLLADQSGLDFLERLQLRDRHEDDDGVLALNLDLLGGGDVELAKVTLEVRVDLEIEQSLRDRLLELVRLLVVGLDNLGACGERHLPSLEICRKS